MDQRSLDGGHPGRDRKRIGKRMKTLAVIGAGPGIGMSIARRFGREGFQVGLVARNAEKLAGYVKDLAHEGIRSAGFPADVTDGPALKAAIRKLESDLGPVTVLKYSPTPSAEGLARSASQLTVENVTYQLDTTLLGAITALEVILPGMVQRGEGALLFTAALSGISPMPSHANSGLALAALRNLVFLLNYEFKQAGIYAGTINLSAIVERSLTAQRLDESGRRESMKDFMIDPDLVAEVYWDMVTKRDRVEEILGNRTGIEAAAWR